MQEKAGSDNNRTPLVFRVPDNPVIGRVAQGNHPQALTDRYVTVARHTAPASLPLEPSRSQAYTNKTRFLPVSWLPIAGCELTHPLRSNPITGSSILIQDDPPLISALVLSRLWDRHLRFPLNIGLITKHNIAICCYPDAQVRTGALIELERHAQPACQNHEGKYARLTFGTRLQRRV